MTLDGLVEFFVVTWICLGSMPSRLYPSSTDLYHYVRKVICTGIII